MNAIPVVGTCDGCQTAEVERRRYRLVRHDGEESRNLSLCSSCRAPLELLFRAVPPKARTEVIVARDITDLLPSPTLLAQAKARRKRPVRKVV